MLLLNPTKSLYLLKGIYDFGTKLKLKHLPKARKQREMRKRKPRLNVLGLLLYAPLLK